MRNLFLFICLILSGSLLPAYSQGDGGSGAVEIAPGLEDSVYISGLDSAYCEIADPVQLSPHPSGGRFLEWVGESNQFSPGAPGPGIHTLRYVYAHPNGSTDTAYATTRVDSYPEAIYNEPEISVWIGNEVYLTTRISEVGTGLWTLESGGGEILEPDHPNTKVIDLPEGISVFRYTIANKTCVRTRTSTVTVMPFPAKRGFSPNGDQKNDFFVIRSLEQYPGTTLQVLNRWGNLMYESEDYQNDWEGKNLQGEDLADDTYFYVLQLPNGLQFNGSVILKR